MDLLLAAVFGALATSVVGLLLVVPADVDRHDRRILERDGDLEEWLIDRHRGLQQRLREIAQQASAQGVERGGTIPAGHTAARTLLLYDYREELRQARTFVAALEIEERWPHRLWRRLKRQPVPSLTTPVRAERVVDYWQEGTARKALSWNLDDLVADLPQRATSRARA